MAVERSEVEHILSTLTPREEVLRELCLAWLALDAAPVVEVTREDWLENAESFAADLIGQRVRLVPETTGARMRGVGCG